MPVSLMEKPLLRRRKESRKSTKSDSVVSLDNATAVTIDADLYVEVLTPDRYFAHPPLTTSNTRKNRIHR